MEVKVKKFADAPDNESFGRSRPRLFRPGFLAVN